MNKRMHELARQAKIEFTLDPTEAPMRAFVECWEDELAKFAESIVQECAALIPAEQSHAPDGRPMAKIFEEHFGVNL
jgi:hypothetical protein